MGAPRMSGFRTAILHDDDANVIDAILTAGVRRLAVDALTSTPTPGATITSQADVVVGALATVVLGVPPANATNMTAQNTGPSGTLIRIREQGGAAGAGILLVRYQARAFEEAVARLEAEDVANIATTVAVQYEGP